MRMSWGEGTPPAKAVWKEKQVSAGKPKESLNCLRAGLGAAGERTENAQGSDHCEPALVA